MIKLPDHTRLPKPHVLYKPFKKGNGDFFDRLALSAPEKQTLREEIALIQVTHQIDSRTTNVPEGKAVKQILVLEVHTTSPDFQKSWLDLLDVRLSLYTLFVVKNAELPSELVVNYKEPLAQEKDGKHFKILRSFQTKEDVTVSLDGQDLDQVYANLVKDMGREMLLDKPQADLKTQIEQTEQLEKLKKQAQQLKKKMYAEKSMRKQMELKKSYKKLLKEIENLS